MVRRGLLRAGLLLLAGWLAAPRMTAQPLPHYSRAERKARIAALPAEDRDWLEKVVAPIITEEEKDVFLSLTEPYQREAFRQDFWKRREAAGLSSPYGPGFRERYTNDLQLASDKYGGPTSDRGQFVLRFGEPDQMVRIDDCPLVLRPIEIWTYSHLNGRERGLTLIFYKRIAGTDRWELWDTTRSEQDLMSPGETGQPGAPQQIDGLNLCDQHRQRGWPPSPCLDGCPLDDAIVQVRAEQGIWAFQNLAEMLKLPKPPLETLGEFASKWATTARLKEAAPIAVQGPSAAGSAPAGASTGRVARASTPASGAAASPIPHYSHAERKARIKALSAEDRDWLEKMVGPIITDEEKDVFLSLTEPYQREAFKQEFWKRREKEGLPAPFGPGYRERYLRNQELANDKYGGPLTDQGQWVMRFGEPDGDVEIDCDTLLRPLQIWTYSHLEDRSRSIQLLFYQVGTNSWRLWDPSQGENVLMTPGLAEKGATISALSQRGLCAQCLQACNANLAEVIAMIESGGTFRFADLAQLLTTPKPSLEGLDEFASKWATTAPTKGAAPIAVEGPSGTQASSAPAAHAAPASNPASAAPASPIPHYSHAERKKRIAALPAEDRDWLEKVVAPIITDEEEDVFLSLTEPYQREAFKQEFWKRREKEGLPPPFGPDYRERYLRDVELANDKYGGPLTDQGQFVMRFGEPDGYVEIDCDTALRPLQIWNYSHLEGRFSRLELLFYQEGTNNWKLWDPSQGEQVLMNPGLADRYTTIAQMNICGRGFGPSVSCSQACNANLESIVETMESGGAFHLADISQLLAMPKPPLEGLEDFASKWASTAPSKGAAPIAVEGPSGGGTAAAAPNAKSAQTAAGPAPGVPAAPMKKLTRKERKELAAALPKKYREWLEDVDLIITDLERDVFLQIHEDYQRDHFIDDFWRRRSIDRDGLRTDFREIYMQRVQFARENFKQLWSDRAKIYLLNGPPDATIAVDCPDVYAPIQIWYYARIELLKANKVYLLFYRKYGLGEYQLWSPIDGVSALYINPTITSGVASPQTTANQIESCPEWRTVQGAIAAMTATFGAGAESMAEMAKLYQPPSIETEGVDRILSMTTQLAANSARLDLNQLVRFPDERNNKIGVDVSLLVPRKDLAQRDLGDEKFYNVDVIGEVVKGDRLLDNFKYRFDIPTEDVGGEKIPLTIRRYLYPGDYELRVKVSDDNRNAEGRVEARLHVPDQPDTPPPLQAAARTAGRVTVDKELGDALPSSISLLPIARDIAVGLQRFETRTAEGIRAVDFYLDGARVMTRTRPPFDADLNLGPLPRKHTIRVVGYGPTGHAVGEDEMVINAGSESFRVKIVSPPKGAKISGNVPVSVALTMPDGKSLQKLEFYSNETRVATLYGPPYIQTVPVHESKNVGYLRVVATLDDGSVAEDLRYVNAPPYLSEVNVDAVELYTTVTEHGRPVTGLAQKNFKVSEDGKLQNIAQFEYVKNLPLTLGVGIDTSASMLESLPDAQKAAVDFLQYSIGQKDRGFTMSFDDEPYILSKLTANKERLVRSLVGLRAEGSTALYDAIVYALYQFQGVKGKKALILLTDGKDTASKFDFDTLLDYVKKAGVSIYAIGLHIPSAELEVKYKLNKLAEATGGVTYYVSSARNLTSIYRSINDELRSQYLLTYYSTNTSQKAEWRKVEVRMDPSSLHARTISGYYP